MLLRSMLNEFANINANFITQHSVACASAAMPSVCLAQVAQVARRDSNAGAGANARARARVWGVRRCGRVFCRRHIPNLVLERVGAFSVQNVLQA